MTTVPLSPSRRLLIDFLGIAHAHHSIHGLIEVDVTEPLRLIREHRERTGQTLSFTAFVIACVATAIQANPSLNAYRTGRRVVLLDDVDVFTIVERNVGAETVAAPIVVRAAQACGYRRIHELLRAAQEQPLDNVADLGGAGWGVRVPGPLRRLTLRALPYSRRAMRRFPMAIGVSAVGMFGGRAGWGIPVTASTVQVTVGGIGTRPVLVAGRLEQHEHVCLTLTFDHDIVDGGPAARFAERLARLIESAHGVRDACAGVPRFRVEGNRTAAPDVGRTAPAGGRELLRRGPGARAAAGRAGTRGQMGGPPPRRRRSPRAGNRRPAGGHAMRTAAAPPDRAARDEALRAEVRSYLRPETLWPGVEAAGVDVADGSVTVTLGPTAAVGQARRGARLRFLLSLLTEIDGVKLVRILEPPQ